MIEGRPESEPEIAAEEVPEIPDALSPDEAEKAADDMKNRSTAPT
jgi:hypothetical protein